MFKSMPWHRNDLAALARISLSPFISLSLPWYKFLSLNFISPLTKILTIPQLGHKITLSPHKAQHHLACGQKESLNSLKSHYDVANSISHYDVSNSKPATMRHYLQNLLQCGISKARCYTAPLKLGTI